MLIIIILMKNVQRKYEKISNVNCWCQYNSLNFKFLNLLHFKHFTAAECADSRTNLLFWRKKNFLNEQIEENDSLTHRNEISMKCALLWAVRAFRTIEFANTLTQIHNTRIPYILHWANRRRFHYILQLIISTPPQIYEKWFNCDCIVIFQRVFRWLLTEPQYVQYILYIYRNSFFNSKQTHLYL